MGELSILIMDAGGVHGSGLRIATNSFSEKEVKLLIKVLNTKFQLNSTLHKNGNNFQIYVKAESIPFLRELILNHMAPSMLYKIGL